MFLGGPIGSGKQWISWIHRDDEILAILFLLEKNDLRGIFNLTSPNPVTMREFARSLGQNLRRPSWFRIPEFMMKLTFGEMAKETLLASQRVYPKKLIDAGFEFQFPGVEEGIKNILMQKNE